MKVIEKESLNAYRVMGYFVIYSIIGFFMETIFALVVYGKLESRQGFLYGPVCPIYGVGSVALILALRKCPKNGYSLFLGGLIVGSAVEFVISLLGEWLLNVRWWDYSDRFLNINGRICLQYSIYWGIISVFLIERINPRVDRLIDFVKSKIKPPHLKPVAIAFIAAMTVDFLLSGFVIDVFLSRTVAENNISAQGRELYEKTYETVYKNKYIEKLMNTVWDEEKIIKVYPNLTLTLEDGTSVMVKDYYKDVQPYYYDFKKDK